MRFILLTNQKSQDINIKKYTFALEKVYFSINGPHNVLQRYFAIPALTFTSDYNHLRGDENGFHLLNNKSIKSVVLKPTPIVENIIRI